MPLGRPRQHHGDKGLALRALRVDRRPRGSRGSRRRLAGSRISCRAPDREPGDVAPGEGHRLIERCERGSPRRPERDGGCRCQPAAARACQRLPVAGGATAQRSGRPGTRRRASRPFCAAAALSFSNLRSSANVYFPSASYLCSNKGMPQAAPPGVPRSAPRCPGAAARPGPAMSRPGGAGAAAGRIIRQNALGRQPAAWQWCPRPAPRGRHSASPERRSCLPGRRAADRSAVVVDNRFWPAEAGRQR
jgi:hypothetical protein